MSAATTGSSPEGDAPGQISLRELIRDCGFALYLVGQTASGGGSALSSVALVFAVLSISRSPGGVGLVLLAGRLPGIALTLLGGVIADRWSRKRIAVSADWIRCALQLSTAVLLFSGHATVGGVAALQLGAGGASALFSPAADALFAGVAPRGQIRRAGSLLAMTTAVTQTAGLAVSGILVALAGPGVALLVDAATFAVSAATLALVPHLGSRPRSSDGPSSVIAHLRDGWRVVIGHRWLVVEASRGTIINVLVLSPFFVLGPVVADERLGGAPAWSGIALGYVIGSLAAAKVTYHWAPSRPVLAAFLISTLLAPMLVLLAVGASLWIVVPAALLAGAETTIYNTLTSATVQANLPPDVLGRAGALTNLGSTVLVPVGMGLAGAVAGAIGTSTVLLCGASIVLVTTVICAPLPATRTRLRLDREQSVAGTV